jgi:hypothetical protein
LGKIIAASGIKGAYFLLLFGLPPQISSTLSMVGIQGKAQIC